MNIVFSRVNLNDSYSSVEKYEKIMIAHGFYTYSSAYA